MSRVTAVLGRGTDCTQSKSASPRRKPRKGATAAAILMLVSLLMAPTAARAGDGKELAMQRGPTQRAASPAVGSRVSGGGVSSRDGAAAARSSITTRSAITSRDATPSRSAMIPRPSGGAPSYGPRYAEIPSQRPGLYPGRQGRSSRGVERGVPAEAEAVAEALGTMETTDDAFVVPPGLTRAGGLAPIVAARINRAMRLDDDELDARRMTTPRRGRDAETEDEKAAATPPPARPARSATPAKSTNRRFPLIVVRDVAARERTRTIPRQKPAKENAAKDDSSTDDSSAAAG
jgi:hypothetical protein